MGKYTKQDIFRMVEEEGDSVKLADWELEWY